MLCLYALHIHTQKWYFWKDQNPPQKKSNKQLRELRMEQKLREENVSWRTIYQPLEKTVLGLGSILCCQALRQGGTLFLIPFSCPDLLYYGAAITDSQAPYLQEFQDLYLSNWNQGMI